ncbi:MAG: hypothetical protein KDD89_13010, partial [Anaerolineales bacterium]|nr:hypothetical protein [Anaerolineales bacterium]
ETTREYNERTLEAVRFVLVQAEEMVSIGILSTTAVADLTDAIMALEIQLGLRPTLPDPEITLLTPAEEALAQKAKHHATPQAAQESKPKPETVKQPQPPRKRRNPITCDNIWGTLLSERTLRAILFLAVLLLFSGAISIVVNEWQSFPRWAQAGFLAGFTAVFYGLGSFVRQRLKLVGSGLALTAVASLLVPLDFYTFYLSGGFPADSGAAVWVLASVVCLIAYTATAYLIQAESFGYLVALAGGSLILSLANWVGLDSVWWQSLTVIYALSLVGMAQVVIPRTNRLTLFTRPFWHVALMGTAVSLLINLMLFLLTVTSGPTTVLAMALSWWLVCALAALSIRRYPLQITVLGMAVAPFIAMWLTQAWLAYLWDWPIATYAIGWTLLMPLYLAVWLGLKRLERQDSDSVTIKKEFVPRLASPVADGANIILGVGLTALGWAALWALSDMYITSVVHGLLAIYAGVTAVRLHRPVLLWLTGLLVMSSSGALLAALDQPLAVLGLVWSGLALIVLGFAVWLANKEADMGVTLARIAVPLAGFATLPALMPPTHNALLVTVGVWI